MVRNAQFHAVSLLVTGINKTTNAATLTYDPWGGGVRLPMMPGESWNAREAALLRMERASARTGGEVVREEGLG